MLLYYIFYCVLRFFLDKPIFENKIFNPSFSKSQRGTISPKPPTTSGYQDTARSCDVEKSVVCESFFKTQFLFLEWPIICFYCTLSFMNPKQLSMTLPSFYFLFDS